MPPEDLSKQFPSHHVTFRAGQGGLPMIRVDHPVACAEIYLQGAHLTHFQPAGEDPVLFVSSKSRFEPGVPIRGGVPICFPWFGPKSGDSSAQAHGFARTTPWQVMAVKESVSGVSIMLSLESSAATRAAWDADFVAHIEFLVGRVLTMTLHVTNRGPEPIHFEEALHTYFAVSDVKNVTVEGLTGEEFIDKTDNLMRKTDSDRRIQFTRETDRLYFNTQGKCFIDDDARGLGIHVTKTSSNSTVVWNPFPTRAEQLKDLGVENWQRFVCVETANAGPDRVELAPGATRDMTATIRLEHRV